MSSDFPTRFVELKLEGDGLVKRLLQMRQNLGNPKTRPKLFDKSFEKIVSKLLSKFPDIPEADKIIGYDALIPKAKALMEDFEYPYYTLVDSFEWRTKALTFLTEQSSKLFKLRLDENPTTTGLFFDLLVRFAQVHLLIGTIPQIDKRLSLAIYSRMYFHLRSQPEVSYSRTAKWVAEYDNPTVRLSDDLKQCLTTISNSMRDFRDPLAAISNVDELRKSEALNITLKPALLGLPVNDYLRFELQNAEKLRMWAAFGFLVAPRTGGEPGVLEGILAPILSESLLLPVAGDVTFGLHSEFEVLWGAVKDSERGKQGKTWVKQKKVIHEAAATAAAAGRDAHRVRRTYLRQELEALVLLMRDTPGLVAPKINVLLAALAFARYEILWYYRHIQASAAAAYIPKKERREDWIDVRVPELVHLTHTLSKLILAQQADVSRYYAAYLSGADVAAVRDAAEKIRVCGGVPAETAAALASAVGSARADDVDSLAAINRSYATLEHAMGTLQSGIAALRQPLLVMRIVAQHSDLVRSLPRIVDDCGSLTELWYVRDAVRESFEQYLRGSHHSGVACIGSYIELVADLPRVATRAWPEERDVAGAECVRIVTDFCEKTAAVSRELFIQVVHTHQLHAAQLRERNAFDIGLSRRPDWKPPKDWVAPVLPGSESEYSARQSVEQLRLAERNLAQITHAISAVGTLAVYDSAITPAEFIREMLQNYLTEWLRTAFRIGQDGSIQRPSEVRRQLLVLLGSMASLEHTGTLGIEQIWREVVINEFFVRECKVGSPEAPPMVELDYQSKAIGSIVAWYGNFIHRVLPASSGSIVYSPSRRGFVSKAAVNVQLKAEDWCDAVELRALASIIGPYGVKVFDTWVLRFVQNQLLLLKEILISNTHPLEEIMTSYAKDAKFAEASRKLKDLDKAVTCSVAIGTALSFRSLLKDSLRDCVRDAAPYVAASISTAFDSYQRNTFIEAQLLSMDFLASDYGEDVGTADQAFKAVLKTVHQEGDQKMWKLLPVLYAVMFLSNSWREAQYIPSLEAHHNNVHVLARVINDVIIGFCSLVINPPEEKQVSLFLTQFIDIASMVLLRMSRIPSKGDKKGPVDFPSIMIFIDKFIDACPLLSRDVLEDCVPYALLRNMFRDVYSAKSTGEWA